MRLSSGTMLLPLDIGGQHRQCAVSTVECMVGLYMHFALLLRICNKQHRSVALIFNFNKQKSQIGSRGNKKCLTVEAT